MRPCHQDGLKNEEGSVLVSGLDDMCGAWHRGKVEAFGGHGGREYARDDSGVVRYGEEREWDPEILQDTIDSSLDLCKNFLDRK
jgi:hypothetical protein